MVVQIQGVEYLIQLAVGARGLVVQIQKVKYLIQVMVGVELAKGLMVQIQGMEEE